VARRLEAACRQSDVVARWGGEEFLVVARLTDRTQAAVQAERLRCAVADGSFALDDGGGLTVTCSVGFAAFPFCRRQPESFGWEQVVAVADHAAYVAKRRGRNSWIGLSPADGAALEGTSSTERLDAWMEEGRLAVDTAAPSAVVNP
jgi:diguanylate cyclase (GGDEF)-like protein